MDIAIIFLVCLVAFYFLTKTAIKSSDSIGYKNCGDGLWFTPQGFVDFTPEKRNYIKLPDFKAIQRESNRNFAEQKYKDDIAFAEWEWEIKQWEYMKDKVGAIHPDEKLTKWIPMWVDYMVEWHKKKEPSQYQKDNPWYSRIEFPPMSLDIFIATKITDNQFVGRRWVMQPIELDPYYQLFNR